ncbi:MAG: beta-ketoacyl synthase [Flavobacteriales bacterium]|nr:beta-ketoacyl synthase [Flavobacteriales bacterium]MBK7297328.1 beta-ketoacyl synthase [Flavobacteriales bacterium]MBK9535990.1 beta-ketoacyl synthase [Flavobacteriales bacterium]MBP9139985.1 beta-ketoacyl synthase [Flavobacteriales bacterium]HQV52128.1 beta-ketoacyl synthase N-terminal-like domain-containing protein [Flavobacteriales bacterium]
MTVTLGAAHVLSPLGEGLAASVERMLNGATALQRTSTAFDTPAVLGIIPKELLPQGPRRIQRLIDRCMQPLVQELGNPKFTDRWGCYIATTKGDIAALENGNANGAALSVIADHVQKTYGFTDRPWVISNACASGTSAIAMAGAAIERGFVDHAVVIGVDVLSRFVLRGFQALHAVSEDPCLPFDAKRKGTSLGEGCAAVVLTKDASILKNPIGTFVSGGIAHDANHISGPSRTGEGLVRAIQCAMKKANLSATEIHAVNAHGTGTDYNDAMESIAFERSGLSEVPLSGYKGWFGHTLGAAGVLESLLALHALNTGLVLRNEGLTELGVPSKVNVLAKEMNVEGDLLLKTSSGFGGCNAAVLLRAKRQ